MLVLSRKLRESILVGDNIVLTVLKIDGNQVSLGVSAPRDVRIDRKELRDRMEWEQKGGPV